MAALKWFGGVLLALVLLLLVWGSLIEPRFLLDIEHFDAEIPNLPAEWDGQQVAFLADFQVGMWGDNDGMVEKAVEEILQTDPALVLIGGDFVYKPDSATVRKAVGLVRPLGEAGVPTFAVLGNHDYSVAKEQDPVLEDVARYLVDELEAAGIQVLENEARAVPNRAPLQVVGIGSVWADRSQPDAALASVPAQLARIVFMHNPVAFRNFPRDAAPLTLAGHTHAGQVRLPLLPSESWLDIARPREVVADGWAADTIGAPGNRLYVNRGIGFSLVPVRIFCKPELTYFTLRQAGARMPERDPGTEGQPVDEVDATS